MTKTISPLPRPPRVSVPVSAEVLEAFQRLGKASNLSTGAAMAEWLQDTLEAAQFMALKVEQARAAPKVVMREMHAYALGLADETGELMKKLQADGKAARTASGRAGEAPASDGGAAKAAFPPPCNTGGKVSTKAQAPKRPRAVSATPKTPKGAK